MPKINQSEINDVAWRACDTFRGVVDAENYRNYILVMLFWKYMSDVWRDHRDAYLKEYKGRRGPRRPPPRPRAVPASRGLRLLQRSTLSGTSRTSVSA